MESGKLFFTLFLLILLIGVVVGIGNLIFRLTQDEECHVTLAQDKYCTGAATIERSLWTGRIIGFDCEGYYEKFTFKDLLKC